MVPPNGPTASGMSWSLPDDLGAWVGFPEGTAAMRGWGALGFESRLGGHRPTLFSMASSCSENSALLTEGDREVEVMAEQRV